MKYLFCIGAQKAGTTYLFNIIKQHSKICPARYKETHFFSKDIEYKRGIESFNKNFSPDENSRYLADFTPEYLPNPTALERIKEHFKDDAVVVVMVRDPIKRAFSQYKMMLSYGKTKKSFLDIVKEELEEPVRYRSLSGRGLYAEQLDEVCRIFNRSNVFVGSLDELSKDREKFVLELLEFLGLEPEPFEYEVNKNQEKLTKVTPVRKFFYKIPLPYRRRFRSLGRIPKKITDRIFDSSRGIPFVPPEIDDESVALLCDYYRKPNKELKDKYGIDTDDWL